VDFRTWPLLEAAAKDHLRDLSATPGNGRAFTLKEVIHMSISKNQRFTADLKSDATPPADAARPATANQGNAVSAGKPLSDGELDTVAGSNLANLILNSPGMPLAVLLGLGKPR
jgi:hypothetical protein